MRAVCHLALSNGGVICKLVFIVMGMYVLVDLGFAKESGVLEHTKTWAICYLFLFAAIENFSVGTSEKRKSVYFCVLQSLLL